MDSEESGMTHELDDAGLMSPLSVDVTTPAPATNPATSRRFSSLWPGPFKRWPRGSDAVLAAVVLVFTMATVVSAFDDLLPDPDQVREPDVLAYLIIAGSSVILYWRRRHPILVLAVVLIAVLVYDALGYPELTYPAILIATYSAGRYVVAKRQVFLYPWMAAVVAAIVIDDLARPDYTAWAIVVDVVIFSSPWLVGHVLRKADDRAAELKRQRNRQAQRIVAQERAHIARELHDIVAHRVSVMTVQAGAAKMVAPVDPQRAAKAMSEVEHAGRQALSELRHLLTVLRPSADAADRLGPQPGVVDVPALVAEHAENGMDIVLESDNLPTDLTGPVDLYAYRIVQESLTNVFKHAGPAAHAEVNLNADGDALTIEVADDGRAAAIVSGAGYGIVGMRERARLLGGTFNAERRPEGGFRVFARLPIGQAS